MSVLGVDQYQPPHSLGSSHAETRVTRLAVGEGPQYLPFVRRSHELWREYEALTGESLLHECGGYIFTEQQPVPGQRWEDFVTETARIAAEAEIDYHVLDPSQVRSKHPFIRVPDDRLVGFEPTAGLVMVERCVATQLQLAAEAGAKLETGRRVEELVPTANEVEVRTDDGASHRADHVVLATGPWFPELAAPQLGDRVSVTRQVVYWFEAARPRDFSTDNMPFIMWIAERDEDYVAVFPSPPGASAHPGPGGAIGVKVMGEQFLETTDPNTVDRRVTDLEIQSFYETHLAPKIDGLGPTCFGAEVCLYTNTTDDHFLIGPDPRSERITAMSPCSGHGFKHSAALGEAVAAKLAGETGLDLSHFGV